MIEAINKTPLRYFNEDSAKMYLASLSSDVSQQQFRTGLQLLSPKPTLANEFKDNGKLLGFCRNYIPNNYNPAKQIKNYKEQASQVRAHPAAPNPPQQEINPSQLIVYWEQSGILPGEFTC